MIVFAPEVIVARALELNDGEVAARTAADKASDDGVFRITRHVICKLPDLILRSRLSKFSSIKRAVIVTLLEAQAKAHHHNVCEVVCVDDLAHPHTHVHILNQ